MPVASGKLVVHLGMFVSSRRVHVEGRHRPSLTAARCPQGQTTQHPRCERCDREAVQKQAYRYAHRLVGLSAKRSRRGELATTLTEENPIAAPAMIRLSRPAVASGIASTL